jgi:hypothetical protein
LTLTSISFPDKVSVNISTILVEILSSRLKMVEQARNGTSINHQELSDLDQPISHSISTTPVKETTCNTTAPHQDGGRCSSTAMDTSPISRMVRSFQSRIELIKKLNQSKH